MLMIVVLLCLVQLSINHDHTYFSNSCANPIIPVVWSTHLLLIIIMPLLFFVERDKECLSILLICSQIGKERALQKRTPTKRLNKYESLP